MSISAIAAAISVPRATVGDWLKGVGETLHYNDCALCRTRFATMRVSTRFCTPRCQRKHHRIWGRA